MWELIASKKAPSITPMDQTIKPCAPSRNSISCSEAFQVERTRPARYPPSAKLPTATTTIQKPDKITSQTEVSRHVGEGDTTIRPTAEAKPIKTKEVAAATIAPAIPGPQ